MHALFTLRTIQLNEQTMSVETETTLTIGWYLRFERRQRTEV